MKGYCPCLVAIVVVVTVTSSALPNSAEDSPNLSDILSGLKGRGSINYALNIIKELKVVKVMLTTAMQISPAVKRYANDLAKKDVKVRILLKMAEDKLPDLRDLYDLSTSHSNMAKDARSVVLQDPGLIQVYELFRKKGFDRSSTDLTTVVQLFTGKLIEFPASVMSHLSNGKYVVTSENDQKYINLVEVTSFMHDNFYLVIDVVRNVFKASENSSKIMQTLSAMNTTHLDKIRTTALDGAKYTVNGAVSSPPTDPQAAKLIQELKSASTISEDKAEDLTIHILEDTVSLIQKVLAELPDTSGSRKEVKQSGAVVG